MNRPRSATSESLGLRPITSSRIRPAGVPRPSLGALSLADVLLSASTVPAESLKLDHELGTIQPGYYADLVILDQQQQVRQTIVQGASVYQAPTTDR